MSLFLRNIKRSLKLLFWTSKSWNTIVYTRVFLLLLYLWSFFLKILVQITKVWFFLLRLMMLIKFFFIFFTFIIRIIFVVLVVTFLVLLPIKTVPLFNFLNRQSLFLILILFMFLLFFNLLRVILLIIIFLFLVSLVIIKCFLIFQIIFSLNLLT